jgi:hypothetical protein
MSNLAAAGGKLVIDNGRERRTDGLLKHLGQIDTSSLRVCGMGGHPALTGAGVETYYNVAALAGVIQCYDRDAQAYRDLTINTHNLTLAPQSGGTLTLPANSVGTAQIQANAVQQPIGSWVGSPSYSNAVAPWVETPLSVTVTSSGGLLRVEWSVTFFTNAAGTVWWGVGWNGAAQAGTSIHNPTAANQSMLASGTFYWTLAAGTYRFALFTGASGATMTVNTGITSSLWVTEQKR